MNEPGPSDKQAVMKFEYLFYAVKGKQLVKLEGAIKVPSLESAKDSMLLVMMRDSRITQGYLFDPITKEALWISIPGILRQQIAEAGFTPDVIQGPSGLVR